MQAQVFSGDNVLNVNVFSNGAISIKCNGGDPVMIAPHEASLLLGVRKAVMEAM